MQLKMDIAKQHWDILQELGTDLASKVRSFMVIGWDGDRVMLTTDDGMGYWFGVRMEAEFMSRKPRKENELTPLDVPGMVSMAQGDCHIVIINRRGEIYTMGDNEHGQLGLGTVDQKMIHSTPQLISLIPSHKFISVRCGSEHSLALTDDGKVWAWGKNSYGQVGVPSSTEFISSPHQISYLDHHRIVAVECGGHHSLALTDQGEVYAWGANDSGQLGDGSLQKYQHSPTRITTPSSVRSMAAGLTHTLLLTRAAQVYTCGNNGNGQLGIPNDTKFSSSLTKVEAMPLIRQISSHHATNLSIAMSFDKRCFVWGELNNGKFDEEELYNQSFDEEETDLSIYTPMELTTDFSTVESPLSFYSTHRSTPHSVQVSDTPQGLLSTRMSRMFDDPETSDVQFVVEQRTIHAHRILLSNCSDYFGRMFSERWLTPVDPENPTVKVITIADHSYEVFHALLRFFYTDHIEVHFDILPELFELATQYLIPELQQLCLSRMRITLIPATCCLYYPLTKRHSFPELEDFRQELVLFVSYRMSEVEESDAYKLMESDLRKNLANEVRCFPCCF